MKTKEVSELSEDIVNGTLSFMEGGEGNIPFSSLPLFIPICE